jgi:hypothetical protein
VIRPEARLPVKQTAPRTAPNVGRTAPVRDSSAANTTVDSTAASAPVTRTPSADITAGAVNE